MGEQDFSNEFADAQERTCEALSQQQNDERRYAKTSLVPDWPNFWRQKLDEKISKEMEAGPSIHNKQTDYSNNTTYYRIRKDYKGSKHG